MKQKYFIDSHKGLTWLAILAMMAFYHQWSNATAWLYLVLHGGYGIMWVLKSRIFGDTQWEQPCTPSFASVIWGSLSLYWIAPWLITSRELQAPPMWMAFCVLLWGFGIFFHFVSDMQKHATLSVRKGLISDGMFSRCRNPNYFGELLIYAGFSLLAMHWLPILALLLFVLFVWVPNMRRKDQSLSRYPEFADYRARSTLFIPYVI